MSNPDRKIAVIIVSDVGALDFQGIYTKESDAETVALANAHKGDVVIISFQQTITDEITAERGIFNEKPLMRVLHTTRATEGHLQ